MSRARAFRTVLTSIFAALLSTCPLLAETRAVQFRSVKDGLTEARNTGKPLLLFITAAWCGPCQELKNNVFSLGTYAKMVEEQYVPIEVVDRRREEGVNPPDVASLLEQLGYPGFPTLVVCRADGTAAVRQFGYVSPAATVAFLREAVGRLEAAEAKQRRAKKRQ